MSKNKRTSLFFSILCISFIILGSHPGEAAEKAPFTVADSLRVKSFSAYSITDDGRYIAGTIGQRIDRLGTDHKRFGDPTYISPRMAEMVILDTETGRMNPLYKTKVHVQSLAWSPDGLSLAYFLRKGDSFRLQIYDRKTGRIREVGLKTQKPIASNSFLTWKNSGQGILLALRVSGASTAGT